MWCSRLSVNALGLPSVVFLTDAVGLISLTGIDHQLMMSVYIAIAHLQTACVIRNHMHMNV